MLLTASFPMVDVRGFVDVDTGRLPAARWASPGAAVDFLPFFGPVRRVPAEGKPPYRPQDGIACVASRALRFPSPSPPGDTWLEGWKCVQRELRATNEACLHLDVAVASRSDMRRGLGVPALSLVERWSKAVLHVRREDEFEPVEIRHVGALLARSYTLATTAASRRGTGPGGWVIAGSPLLFVQWAQEERDLVGALLDREFEESPDGLRVAFVDLPAAGAHARAYLVESPFPGALAARELRSALVRDQAEREGLRAILDGISTGFIAPRAAGGDVEKSPAWNALYYHLRDTLRALGRAEKHLPRVSRARPPAESRVEKRSSGSAAEALDEALRAQGAPFNVRHASVDFYADQYGEPSPRPTKGTPRGFVLESLAEPPPVEAPARTRVDSIPLRAVFKPIDCEAVEPEQVVEFLLDLQIAAASFSTGAGATLATRIVFPPNQDTVELQARVSSRDFEQVGRPWQRTFRITRDGPSPAEALFLGRAIGSKPFYEICINFQVKGSFEGTLSLKLPRRGVAAKTDDAPAPSMGVRTDRAGARVMLTLGCNGPNRYDVSWFDTLRGTRGEGTLASNTDAFFNDLLNWTSKKNPTPYPALRDACKSFGYELPKELQRFLEDPDLSGAPMLVVSAAPIFPIEFLYLDDDRPLLGMDRPVLRWVEGEPLPDLETLRVHRMLCIRPTYTKDPLPDAAEEERSLRDTFRCPMEVAEDRETLERELQEGEAELVHFAGHAQDSPPRLSLGDSSADVFEPSGFLNKPLVKNGRPFLFLNGCKAAKAVPGQPASRSNMMKMLLRADFSGAVAPVVEVVSSAAKQAASTFYENLSQGKTVGEAVQAIRCLALRDPRNAGTYLSYLAYASPNLGITFEGSG